MLFDADDELQLNNRFGHIVSLDWMHVTGVEPAITCGSQSVRHTPGDFRIVKTRTNCVTSGIEIQKCLSVDK